MSDIVLRNIDQVLMERIGRIADANGWELQGALMHLLEHGLFACETEMAARLSSSDADALKAAIAALEKIPDDGGFSLIGKAGAAPNSPRPPGPDRADPPRLFED